MPFREKTAWAALIGIVTAAIIYFGAVAVLAPAHPPHIVFIVMLVAAIAGQALITTIAMIIVAVRAPADAHAPADERERQIERSTAGLAYFPLLVGVMLAIGSVHLGMGLFVILNTLLAVVMLTEALRYGLQIRAYRSGL